MLKAVIFDMDGVIIDSEPQHARAAIQAMEQIGVSIDTAFCYRYIGSTTKEMMSDIKEEYQLSHSVEELVKMTNDAKQHLADIEGYPVVPDVKEAIAGLYKDGIWLAIASSSPLSSIEDVTKKLGIRKYFKKLISATQVKNSKPEPDVFLLALQELGVSAEETVVIEDSFNGLLAAEAAGIASVGFMNEHSGEQDLSHATVLTDALEGIDKTYLEQVLLRHQGKPITIADTKRLIIRELAVSDIQNMYHIQKDPNVSRYIDDMEDMVEQEIEKHKAYIKYVYAFYGYGLWGVFSKTTDGLIGKCGLEQEMVDGESEITLSYLLDFQHWGYGYALECCNAVLAYAKETLHIPRVIAVIDKLNTRSINTAERLGMVYEKDTRYKGRNCVVYVKNLL